MTPQPDEQSRDAPSLEKLTDDIAACLIVSSEVSPHDRARRIIKVFERHQYISDWTVDTSILAGKIMTYLGHVQGGEGSLEPGASPTRDRVAAMIQTAFDTRATQSTDGLAGALREARYYVNEFVVDGDGDDKRKAQAVLSRIDAALAAKPESEGAGDEDRVQILEATVTAWQAAVESLEAHLMDRIAMNDASDPKTYLAILRSEIKRVREDSTAIVNARWEDYRRQEDKIKELRTQIAASSPISPDRQRERSRVIEECARVVDDEGQEIAYSGQHDNWVARQHALKIAAAKIRALAAVPSAQEKE